MSSYPEPGAAFGRYDVTGVLGHGGMGVVFRAVHRDLRRPVALKVMSPLLVADAAYRDRFLHEARLLARLDSPHVVRVHDAGDQDGRLFIATELVTGGDLQSRLAAQGAQPVDVALRLAVEAARGLAAAHAAGVLHRDLKPSNVLLRRGPDGVDTAVLCDLGIAKARDDTHLTPAFVGTPGYMAPERHDGRPAGVASDVYELGCVLVALLTGAAPYAGTLSQVAIAHLQGPVPQLPGRDPLTRDLNVVLRRALAKDPAARYATITDLGAALDAIRDGTYRVPASPPRRRRWVVPALVAALVLTVGAAVASAVMVGGAGEDRPAAGATTTVSTPRATTPPRSPRPRLDLVPVVGECHHLTAADLARPTLAPSAVDCADATARTVHVGTLRTHSDAALDRVGATCWRPTVRALGVSPRRYAASLAGFAYFGPSDAEWAAGARWFRCELVLVDGGTLLTVADPSEILLDARGTSRYAACLDGHHRRVRCSAPAARYDVAGTFTLGRRRRPADDALLARAGAECPAMTGPVWYATWPSEAVWRAGYRLTTCWRPR